MLLVISNQEHKLSLVIRLHLRMYNCALVTLSPASWLIFKKCLPESLPASGQWAEESCYLRQSSKTTLRLIQHSCCWGRPLCLPLYKHAHTHNHTQSALQDLPLISCALLTWQTHLLSSNKLLTRTLSVALRLPSSSSSSSSSSIVMPCLVPPSTHTYTHTHTHTHTHTPPHQHPDPSFPSSFLCSLLKSPYFVWPD